MRIWCGVVALGLGLGGCQSQVGQPTPPGAGAAVLPAQAADDFTSPCAHLGGASPEPDPVVLVAPTAGAKRYSGFGWPEDGSLRSDLLWW